MILNRIFRRLTQTLLAAAVMVSSVTAEDARTDRSLEAVREGLRVLLAAKGEHAEIIALADTVRAAARLAPRQTTQAAASGDSVASGTGAVEQADLRLALIQLAIGAGTNDQLALVKAQPDSSTPRALVVRSGVMTLTELGELAKRQRISGFAKTGDTWVLKRPLVIWQGATLFIAPGERLEMSASEGAFLLSFGNLRMTGASVSGDGGQNIRAKDFQPFVLVTGAGTVAICDSKLAALGFGKGSNFGGLVVMNSGLFQPEFGPQISGNTFEHVATLKFEGSADMALNDNTIVAGRVRLDRTNNVEIHGNLFSDSLEPAAIDIGDAARDIALDDNVFLNARGMGILVDGLSRRIAIAGNTMAGGSGVGVNLRRSDCLAVQGNLIAALDSTAVRLTTTANTWLNDNAFVLNARAGADLLEQKTGARSELVGNWFSGNGIGLRGGNIGEVTLIGNDLSDQLPRQFGGEFAQHLPGYLTAVEAEPEPESKGYLIRDLRVIAPQSIETAASPAASWPPEWPQICLQE